MHVFVTGATGWVGTAVVDDLIDAGHTVSGLARSQNGADALQRAGATIVRGTLDDLDVLKTAASKADAVIHTAFNHDFSKFLENCAQDRRAIEAMGSALEGTTKPFLATSGFAHIAKGRSAVESDSPPVPSPAFPRESEAATKAIAAKGVRASVVRLAPSVHGTGDHGFVPILIKLAREKGVSAYIGDGQNRWAGVHRFDAARLYRLAIEHGVEDGPFHAAGEDGVPFKDIAETIGRKLGLDTISVAPDKAPEHFGWFANFAKLDMSASSAKTRALLKWNPTHPTLIEDLEAGHYFA